MEVFEYKWRERMMTEKVPEQHGVKLGQCNVCHNSAERSWWCSRCQGTGLDRVVQVLPYGSNGYLVFLTANGCVWQQQVVGGGGVRYDSNGYNGRLEWVRVV